jgi:hypothetical protein
LGSLYPRNRKRELGHGIKFGIICRIITIGIISIITIRSNIIPGGKLNKLVLLFRGIILFDFA